MASVSERLALIIDFKGDSAIKGLDGVARKSESADEKTRGLSDKLTKMGATGLAASGVAAVGLSKLASSASDLNEVTNKARVLFGDAYGEIDKFASSAAKNLGQSKTAALEAASTFAGLGRAAGLSGGDLSGFSTSLTTLASDLASFGNTSPEEAVQALGSALRGEAEPIRAYNVLLDDAKLKNRALQMGLIETTSGTLPPAIKVQAAYAEIMAQTAAAQGDFKNTSDGLANQQRILKAEINDLAAGIGKGMLPMFTSAIHLATDLAGKFNDLSPSTQSLIGALGAGGVGVTAVVSGISLIAGQVAKMKDRFTDADGSLNAFGQAAGVTGIAVVGLTTVLSIMQKRSQEARERVDNLQASVKTLGITAGDAATREVLKLVNATGRVKDAMSAAGISNEELRDAVTKGGQTYDDVKAKLEAYARAEERRGQVAGESTGAQQAAARGLIAEIDKQRAALATLNAEQAKDLKTSEDLVGVRERSIKGLGEQRRAIQDNIDEHEDYTAALEQEKRVQENAERATEELTKALDDQKKKNDDLYQSFLTAWSGQNIDLPKAIDDVKTSLLNYYDAAQDADKATKEHGATSEEAQRAQLALNDASRGGYEAIQAVARVALETEAARRGIAVDALTAAEKVSIQKQALNDLKKEVPEYTGAIDDVSKSFDGMASSAEDAASRVTTAMQRMRDELVGIFNSIDIGNGLSMITATADRLDEAARRIGGTRDTLNALSEAAKVHGPDAVNRAINGGRA